MSHPIINKRSERSWGGPTGSKFLFFVLRILAVTGISVAFFSALALAVLLNVTPSVRNAPDIARAHARVHHIPYPGPQPPPNFVKALVATEDQRYFSPLDPGVDPFAVGRAVIAAVSMPHRDAGGSTIAQQLAKLLYTPGQHGLAVKIERVGLAIKLHFEFSHAEILTMYAEMAYYGGGYYGLAAASCGYFGRRPEDLTGAQAAMLAGVVNAPTADDPRTHPSRARRREAHVLKRLVAVGYITSKQSRDALAAPLGLVPRRHESVETGRRQRRARCHMGS